MGPLIYLELHALINSLKNVTRSPKRIIPGLILFVTIVAGLMNNLFVSRMGHHSGASLNLLGSIPVEKIETIVFCILAAIVVFIIYNALDTGIMAFSLSDIDFLFATPLLRRDVLLYKLIKDYAKYTVWILFIVIFVLPGITTGLGAVGVDLFPDGLISLSALLALVYLVANIAHLVNIIFTMGFSRLRGMHKALKIALLAIPALAIVYTIFGFIRTGDIWVSLLWMVDSPVPAILLAPAKWTAKLILAPIIGMTDSDWGHLAFLWILAGSTFLILLSRRENIYEPALKVSAKYAKQKQAMVSGDVYEADAQRLLEKGVRKRGAITLPSNSSPFAAIYWKNLLIKIRAGWARVLVMLLMPLLAVIFLKLVASEKDLSSVASFIPVYLACLLPISVQADIRDDLRHAHVVKCMPIPSVYIMLAQICSSVTVSAISIAVTGIFLAILIPGIKGTEIFAILVCSMMLTVPVTSAYIISGLLYPNTRDVAQNYLVFLIGGLISGVACIVIFIVALFCTWYMGFHIFVSTLFICITIMIFGAAGITLAGQLFKSCEPSSD